MYLVLPLQMFVVSKFFSRFIVLTPILLTTLLATTEELMKFAAVYFIAFKTAYFDEPIDAVIYLVTAALGFAAMENVLYVLKDMAQGGALTALVNGSSRFLGAELLHTISSMIIGIAMAYSFYSGRFVKTISVVLGLTAAIFLHAYFNLSIMNIKGTLNVLLAFTPYWAAIIGIIVVLEFVKRLKKPTNNSSL